MCSLARHFPHQRLWLSWPIWSPTTGRIKNFRTLYLYSHHECIEVFLCLEIDPEQQTAAQQQTAADSKSTKFNH